MWGLTEVCSVIIDMLHAVHSVVLVSNLYLGMDSVKCVRAHMFSPVCDADGMCVIY